jgi:hypothetical protein
MVAALAATLLAAGETDGSPSRVPSRVSYQCGEFRSEDVGQAGVSLICGDCHGIDRRLRFRPAIDLTGTYVEDQIRVEGQKDVHHRGADKQG